MPSLARATVFNAIGTAAMLGSGFLTTLIAARLLGTQAVGLVAFASLIATLALAVLDFGIPGAMVRFLPELRAKPRGFDRAIAGVVLVPYAAISVLAGAAVFVFLRLTNVDLGADPAHVAELIAVSIVVQSLAAFHYGVLKGQQRFAQFAVLAGVAGAVQVIAATAGAYAYGVAGVLAASALSYALPAIAALGHIRHAKINDGLHVLRRLLVFSAHTWVIYVFTTISWSRLEVYFLREAWGDHAAGVFVAGLNLANLALQGPMFLTGALLPYLVVKQSENRDSIAPAFGKTLQAFAFMIIPLTLGTAAATPILLPLLYGDGFRDGIPAATVLIAGNAAMAVIAVVQQFAFVAERTRALLVWSAGTAGMTVLSGFTLIAHLGVMGAAVGRASLLIASAGIMLMLAHRWKLPVPYRVLGLITGASASAALGLALALRHFGF